METNQNPAKQEIKNPIQPSPAPKQEKEEAPKGDLKVVPQSHEKQEPTAGSQDATKPSDAPPQVKVGT